MVVVRGSRCRFCRAKKTRARSLDAREYSQPRGGRPVSGDPLPRQLCTRQGRGRCVHRDRREGRWCVSTPARDTAFDICDGCRGAGGVSRLLELDSRITLAEPPFGFDLHESRSPVRHRRDSGRWVSAQVGICTARLTFELGCHRIATPWHFTVS